MYLVYLGLPRPETHTTGAIHVLPLHHQSQDCRLNLLKLPAARSSASRSVAEPSESSSLFVALHICAPPCILHALLYMHRFMAVHQLGFATGGIVDSAGQALDEYKR